MVQPSPHHKAPGTPLPDPPAPRPDDAAKRGRGGGWGGLVGSRLLPDAHAHTLRPHLRRHNWASPFAVVRSQGLPDCGPPPSTPAVALAGGRRSRALGVWRARSGRGWGAALVGGAGHVGSHGGAAPGPACPFGGVLVGGQGASPAPRLLSPARPQRPPATGAGAALCRRAFARAGAGSGSLWAQAGLKALYTCTSWYAYAAMSGSPA